MGTETGDACPAAEPLSVSFDHPYFLVRQMHRVQERGRG